MTDLKYIIIKIVISCCLLTNASYDCVFMLIKFLKCTQIFNQNANACLFEWIC